METEEAVAAHGSRTLELQVRQIRFEGKGINSYEFVDAEGSDLPAFDAGAHIDVDLGDGLIRQYSLCNDPAERHRYVIAVLKDENGRGGSKTLHQKLRVQDTVRVSRPRNNFALVRDAEKVILLAGGIGVTPLKSMAHELEKLGIDYELHYCARDASCAAFSGEFKTLREAGHLYYHFDGGDPAAGLDIERLLSKPSHGAHIYYCGPGGFMKACAAATAHWPAGTVHFEHFKAPERPAVPATGEEISECFDVRIASTGQTIRVRPGQPITDALQEAGVAIETSCCAGLCATCKVRYLEGEVDHNDFILGDDEKTEYLTPCVSRAVSKLLVLDL
ncbi:PDR/VanB family oxidoreductase [Paraburkholderia sp. MM5482-R1]|uniref:PDR/VanB family oxidoreductase n=1 Tax=unclassified Paraburkholderia TaxID=2615204 RepID=UPI003D257E10